MSLDKLYFAKVKPDAIIPTKRDEDGCYDVYILQNVKTPIVIKPQEIVEVETGLASAFSPKYRLDTTRERGSTGFGLKINSGQIDSGYRGEWFLKLHNTSKNTIIITNEVDKVKEEEADSGTTVYYPLKKAICQAALELVPEVEEEEIAYEELLKIESDRGTGKKGSSGK